MTAQRPMQTNASRHRLTEARLKRCISAARAVDRGAIVEVTAEGTIRILPASSAQVEQTLSEVDEWFKDDKG